MARLTFAKLRSLVHDHTDWRNEGFEPPETVLYITLPRAKPKDNTLLHPELAKKVVSYEGATVTVNIDFDERGYITGIEFV